MSFWILLKDIYSEEDPNKIWGSLIFNKQLNLLKRVKIEHVVKMMQEGILGVDFGDGIPLTTPVDFEGDNISESKRIDDDDDDKEFMFLLNVLTIPLIKKMGGEGIITREDFKNGAGSIINFSIDPDNDSVRFKLIKEVVQDEESEAKSQGR